MNDVLAAAVRLVAAAAAGVALGAPWRTRPGGVRTHALVAMGAVFFCAAAIRNTDDAAAISRVIQGVATGVGFIGAAAVLKQSVTVQGVNAAASIWMAAALGVIIALADTREDAAIAIVYVVIAASVNWALTAFEQRRRGRRRIVVAAPAL